MIKRAYNFSAGPSSVSTDVMKIANKQFMNYKKSGYGVMEMTHRDHEFGNLIKKAEYRLRSYMKVPDNYKILFMQGGGAAQFSAVPMNLVEKNNIVQYIDTGYWTKQAINEAKKYTHVDVSAYGNGLTCPKWDKKLKNHCK